MPPDRARTGVCGSVSKACAAAFDILQVVAADNHELSESLMSISALRLLTELLTPGSDGHAYPTSELLH